MDFFEIAGNINILFGKLLNNRATILQAVCTARTLARLIKDMIDLEEGKHRSAHPLSREPNFWSGFYY